MIELSAIFSHERSWVLSARSQQSPSTQRVLQKECRNGQVSLAIHGDEAIDRFVFDTEECSLICRADLIADEDVHRSPAIHIAQAYLREGDIFPLRLRGAFAVILVDHRTGTLKAWTDHFGIEKLVYLESKNLTGIATDLRLLVSALGLSPQIDSAAIPQYLQYSAIPTPKTIYKGISKLAPGHALICTPRPKTHLYWDMDYDDDDTPKSESEWASDTFEAVRTAVDASLRGVPESDVGCFLSGGTDSSSVSGLVGQLTGRPPKTFSIGFDDRRYNEIHYARIAAKKYAARHHEYFVKPSDIIDLVQRAVPAFDEPFGNSSIIPTYYCARLAKENGVPYLLAGDGGDELFGGNARYVDDQIFQHYGAIPGFLRKGLIEPAVSIGALTKVGLFDKASRYVRRANIPLSDRIFSYSLISSVPDVELFSRDFISQWNDEHRLTPARTHFSAARTRNDLNRWMYLDLKLIITDNDLRKVSTMSRLAGVTTRYPLLDPDLAEFSGTIPAGLKVKGKRLRYLFKKAMASILPPEIITKSKHGFGLPYSVWVGEYKPLRDFTFDVLGSSRCRERGYFRSDLLSWLWSQYESVQKTYYGDILWVFLMLELWHASQHDPSPRPELALIPADGLAN